MQNLLLFSIIASLPFLLFCFKNETLGYVLFWISFILWFTLDLWLGIFNKIKQMSIQVIQGINWTQLWFSLFICSLILNILLVIVVAKTL